jgi:hypothetical protein
MAAFDNNIQPSYQTKDIKGLTMLQWVSSPPKQVQA